MGNLILLHALGTLAQAIPASLHTEHPNTSTSKSCHFAFPSSCDGFCATLWRAAFHREAHHLLFYSKALLTLSEGPAKIKLLHCYTAMATWRLPNLLTGASQPALTCKILTMARFPPRTPMLNAHETVAFNFLSLSHPALLYLFRSPWGGNCSDCRTTMSVAQPQAALEKNGQQEGQECPWDPQRKRNDEAAVAEAAPCHRKARMGFAAAPDISNPQGRKGNPGVSTNSDVQSSAGKGALLPNPHWQSRARLRRTHPPRLKELLEHQASPQPAVSAPLTKAENTTKPSFSANHSLIFLFVQ